ncbi:MAG: alcohol dehydrogenase (NADP+) [Saprospiraceae bacterium]|jgi:alcohol dehydrogenase (NADP+)
MKTLKFRDNDEMPTLGLGTWNSKLGEVYKAVKTAIKIGYRHIDCAMIYGNQEEIGQALSDSISEGVVARKDIWVTSKLWNNSHAKVDVIAALRSTLEDLQIDYLDLYLIHWPVALKKEVLYPQSAEDMLALNQVPITETWTSMEEAAELGLTKHIGVSNFGVKTLTQLISNCKIVPEMNQVESHPYLQQKELLAFCHSNDIHYTAYCPLGSSNRPERLKTENEPILLDDPIINEIAKSKNVTAAQILISWARHRGVSVIPKSTNEGRILQNFNIGKIDLSEDEMQRISALDRHHRYISGETWVFDGGPYTVEEIFG